MQNLLGLIGKVGIYNYSTLPFDIGTEIRGLDGKLFWKLHNGTRKSTGEPVTLFVCDSKTSSPEEMAAARRALKVLKTTRHPSILKYVDSTESDTMVYIATEPVIPLALQMEEEEFDSALTTWGIHEVATALSFLSSGNTCHGGVCMYSVYVDPAGEWRLGGFEYSVQADQKELPPKNTFMSKYDPPEKARAGAAGNARAADSWGLGCLIWEVFSGSLASANQLKMTQKLPELLVPHYAELIAGDPRKRASPKTFLENCQAAGQYLSSNFVKANIFLRELQLYDQKQQKRFFQNLLEQLDHFPRKFCTKRIFTYLQNGLISCKEPVILAPLFKIGSWMSESDYLKFVLPCVMKLFSSNDRATRMMLLQHLEPIVAHLDSKTVEQQIFPHIVTGFNDTLPVMREHTLKAMVHLIPKLPAHVFDNKLFATFMRLVVDTEPAVRTNTAVCIGKVAPSLPEAFRINVLSGVIAKSSMDTFVPSRIASVMVIGATFQFFPLQRTCEFLLRRLADMLLDTEKSVRDLTSKTIRQVIEHVEQSMDKQDSARSEMATEKELTSSIWSNWGVSSLTAKIYSSQGGTKTGTEPPAPSTTPKSTISALSSQSVVSGVSYTKPNTTVVVGDLDAGNGWETTDLGEIESRGLKDNTMGNNSDTDYEDWDVDTVLPSQLKRGKSSSVATTGGTVAQNGRGSTSEMSNQPAGTGPSRAADSAQSSVATGHRIKPIQTKAGPVSTQVLNQKGKSSARAQGWGEDDWSNDAWTEPPSSAQSRKAALSDGWGDEVADDWSNPGSVISAAPSDRDGFKEKRPSSVSSKQGSAGRGDSNRNEPASIAPTASSQAAEEKPRSGALKLGAVKKSMTDKFD